MHHARGPYRETPQHGLRIPDPVWIRDAGAHGWLALTQDQAILTRPLERAAVIEHAAGLVILEPGDAVNYDVLSFIIRRMDGCELMPWSALSCFARPSAADRAGLTLLLDGGLGR